MDALSWVAVGAVVGIVTMSLTFAKFWMSLSSRITEAKLTAEGAKAKVDQLDRDVKAEAESAGLRAVQANLKIDTLGSAVADFKLHAERYFVNHDDLRQFSAHHDTQFNDLKSDLKDIKHQLTRLVETQARLGVPPINA